MKLAIYLIIILTSQAGYSQFDADKNWPKLKFETNSKLNIHKNKIQLKAYPSQAKYNLRDTILLTVEINRAVKQDRVDLPNIPMLKHIASARSVQYGTTSKEHRYAWFVYRVKYVPTQTGAIYIDPIPIEIEGKRYETNKVKIDVE